MTRYIYYCINYTLSHSQLYVQPQTNKFYLVLRRANGFDFLLCVVKSSDCHLALSRLANVFRLGFDLIGKQGQPGSFFNSLHWKKRGVTKRSLKTEVE
jgi:hypothetical protein